MRQGKAEQSAGVGVCVGLKRLIMLYYTSSIGSLLCQVKDAKLLIWKQPLKLNLIISVEIHISKNVM